MDEAMVVPAPHPAAALVALLQDLYAAGKARGQMVNSALRLPIWDEDLLGVVELVSIDGPFPVKVTVTIPWNETMEQALAEPTPNGSWTVLFCWERVPAPEWEFRDIPAIATLLRAGMQTLPGVPALTISVPMVVDDTSWGLGAVALRHDWRIDLADLNDAEARATALESIVVHAIDGLRWLGPPPAGGAAGGGGVGVAAAAVRMLHWRHGAAAHAALSSCPHLCRTHGRALWGG